MNINELTAKCNKIIEDAKARHNDVQIYAPILRWSEFMTMTEALEAAQSRIAELEARTLTVTLPERCECCYSESEAAMFDGVVAEFTERLELACAVQGIKLQIEGEE